MNCTTLRVELKCRGCCTLGTHIFRDMNCETKLWSPIELSGWFLQMPTERACSPMRSIGIRLLTGPALPRLPDQCISSPHATHIKNTTSRQRVYLCARSVIPTKSCMMREGSIPWSMDFYPFLANWLPLLIDRHRWNLWHFQCWFFSLFFWSVNSNHTARAAINICYVFSFPDWLQFVNLWLLWQKLRNELTV